VPKQVVCKKHFWQISVQKQRSIDFKSSEPGHTQYLIVHLDTVLLYSLYLEELISKNVNL